MKNQTPKFTSSDYSADIIGLIGQLPASRIEFDLVPVNGRDALVMDAYGLGKANLDGWVVKLKHLATPGAIYAFDHRMHDVKGDDLPQISLLFEGIKSLGELSELVNEHNTETAELIEEALYDARVQAVKHMDEKLNDRKVAKSARLLAFAAAF